MKTGKDPSTSLRVTGRERERNLGRLAMTETGG